MKKLLLIGAAFTVLIAPAMAAEKPVRVHKRARPVVVAAPVYSWTGFYVGGNVGYGWGDPNTDLTANGSAGSTVSPVIGSWTSAASNTSHPNGVIGGGQIGYNYQFGPYGVAGFETDIQASSGRGSGPFDVSFQLPQLIAGGSSFTGALVTGYQARIKWFGTVRGRLGILVGNQLLIYGTAGLAYGEVATSGNANISTALVGFLGSAWMPTGAAFDVSRTNVGFSVGGGVEGSYGLPPNWTWKLEYLYLDLGSVNTAVSYAAAPPGGTSLTALTGTITAHTHFTDNIVRVGLNYKFGNYYAPVVTK